MAPVYKWHTFAGATRVYEWHPYTIGNGFGGATRVYEWHPTPLGRLHEYEWFITLYQVLASNVALRVQGGTAWPRVRLPAGAHEAPG
jgi:hypothetical protein